jgi:hypothetical protein
MRSQLHHAHAEAVGARRRRDPFFSPHPGGEPGHPESYRRGRHPREASTGLPVGRGGLSRGSRLGRRRAPKNRGVARGRPSSYVPHRRRGKGEPTSCSWTFDDSSRSARLPATTTGHLLVRFLFAGSAWVGFEISLREATGSRVNFNDTATMPKSWNIQLIIISGKYGNFQNQLNHS